MSKNSLSARFEDLKKNYSHPNSQTGYTANRFAIALMRDDAIIQSPLHPAEWYSEDIERLYSDLTKKPYSKNNAQFVTDVITTARVLFGRQLRGFLAVNERNPYMTKQSYLFLRDMLAKIKGQDRSLALNQRITLMYYGKDDPYAVTTDTPFLTSLCTGDLGSCDYMYHWLSSENGIEDFLITARFIFGKNVLS